jgi:hypothetical protein
MRLQGPNRSSLLDPTRPSEAAPVDPVRVVMSGSVVFDIDVERRKTQMQRAWLRPGPGDPQAEDEAMLRLLWLCGSVAEDSLIRQLADLMLGDLPVSA